MNRKVKKPIDPNPKRELDPIDRLLSGIAGAQLVPVAFKVMYNLAVRDMQKSGENK